MSIHTEEITAVENQQTAVPKKKTMPSAIRAILCILLSLPLAVTIIVATASALIRMTVTENNIDKILDNTDYMTIPLTIDNIQSNIYEMFFTVFSNSSSEPVDIYKLAEETEFNSLVAEQLYNYTSFVLYNEKFDIDSEIIKDFYDENADEINSAFNITCSKDEIYSIIEEYDYFFDNLEKNEIEDAIPMIELIRFVMSPVALIILAVLSFLGIVLIGVLSRSVGTPLVVTGIISTAAGLAGAAASCLSLFGIIGIPATPVTTASVIWQGVVSTVIPDIFTIFVYILTAGILLILTGGFIGQIRRNIRRAKNS